MRAAGRHRKARSIFISYSREGAQAHAVNLYQGLVNVLGKKAVYLDVGEDAMEAGRPWRESVRTALANCDTLLLVFDPGMPARLVELNNAVLFELESALELGKNIVCIRIDGAKVPTASTLPESLSNLSEWHSPEVHSDAVVADIKRVIKELTGRVPGQVPVIDRWDVVVLVGLAILCMTVWFTVGRTLLSLKETWLWGAAFVIPWLVWMAFRRALSIGNRGRTSLSYRQASSWLVVLTVFGSGLYYAGLNMYRLQEFKTDGGILISRLAGDPNNQLQSALVMELSGKERSGDESKVAALQRRIGFDFAGNPYDGQQRARRYGTETGAAVVLWGKLMDEAEGLLAVNLAFIRREGLFVGQRGSRVTGVMETRQLKGIQSNLELLAKTLPRFLSGYRLYRVAQNEGDLEVAEGAFSDAIKDLGVDRADNSEQRQALDEILASLHFFRANTLLYLGRKNDAVVEYTAAVNQTADGERPKYIAAANNLGWLLADLGKIEEALDILKAIDHECTLNLDLSGPCAYVAYNRGDVLSDQGLHEGASVQFRLAIERIHDQKSAPESDYQRLEAHSYQYLAYSLVRQAAALGTGEKPPFLEEAQEAWGNGMNSFKQADLDAPEFFRITLGRIHIERREWNEAISVLTSIDASPDRLSCVHALLAGAYACTANADQLEKHLTALLLFENQLQASEDYCPPKNESMDEVNRIKRLCAEALKEPTQ